MSHTTPPAGRRRLAFAAGLVLTLVLAACSSTASPTPDASMPSSMSMAGAVSTVAAPSASPAGPVRCAVTPDASPSATIQIVKDSLGFFNFDAPATIRAGQAVVFTAPNGSPHTLTEGTYGKAADNACVNVGIANDTSVTVTFYQPGTYQITCRPHPPMQTSVTVQ
jgi:plastocyanin